MQVVGIDVPRWGRTRHLRVRRIDETNRDPIPWEDLQAIKDEAFGLESVAVEVYPAALDVVNEAPIRHLFECPPGAFAPNLKVRW